MNINSVLKASLICLLLLNVSAVYAELSSDRKQQLEHLLKHDCGSCHGMTLKGGLGPALLAENLKDKPDEFLFLTIQQGRPGTPMPSWKAQLNKNDINWIIHLLRQAEAND